MNGHNMAETWAHSPGIANDALRIALTRLEEVDEKRFSDRMAINTISWVNEAGRWELQYGWIARFSDGEEYEAATCDSLGDAIEQAARLQAREVSDSDSTLKYTVRRKLIWVASEWEEV